MGAELSVMYFFQPKPRDGFLRTKARRLLRQEVWVEDMFQWLFLVLYVRLMAVFISERCVAGKE